MSLKREVGALQNENEHLRTLLHLADSNATGGGLVPQGLIFVFNFLKKSIFCSFFCSASA